MSLGDIRGHRNAVAAVPASEERENLGGGSCSEGGTKVVTSGVFGESF